MMKDYVVKKVGVVKCSQDTPRFGGWRDLESEIHITPTYVEGLEGIEGYSHPVETGGRYPSGQGARCRGRQSGSRHQALLAPVRPRGGAGIPGLGWKTRVLTGESMIFTLS